MNREIKFRAWVGDRMIYQTGALVSMQRFFRILEFEEVKVIMQYTGREDKNGKEIFEGDIVNGCSFNGSFAYGIVVWDNSWSKFVVYGIGRFIEGSDDLNNTLIEVIGNVYENQDLLK